MKSIKGRSPDPRWASGSLRPPLPTPLPPQRNSRIRLAIHQTPVQSVATHLLGGSDAIWIVQDPLGYKDVTTTVIYTHALNRGPAAVRSPADRLLTFPVPPREIDCTILQPSSAALMPPAMGRAKYIQPVPPHPENSDEGNRLQQPAALKEIDRSVYF